MTRTLGILATDERNIRIQEEDRDDIKAFLIANGILPDRVLVGTVIDARHGRLRLDAIAVRDDGRLAYDREGPVLVQLDLELRVPYVKEARP